jgi:hypothetical protein
LFFFFLASTPFITKFARTPQKTRNRTPLHSSVSTQNFETLPLHPISWHPLPTQHLPRSTVRHHRAFSFVSCRLRTSVTPHTTRASSLGEHPPPPSGPPTRSRRRHVPLLHRGHGLGAYLSTSLGPGRQKGHVPLYTTVWASGLPWSRPSAHAPARAYRLLLPRRDSLPTRLPQRDRPGCNASPQDREFTPSGSLAGPVTVRDHARLRPAWASRLLLPRRDRLPTRLPQRDRPGCNASPQDRESTPSGSLAGPVTVRDHARLRPASVSLSRPGHAPQRASTVHRSRQPAPEPCLTRPPADSTHGRHKARCALQSKPFVQMSWRRTLTGTSTDGLHDLNVTSSSWRGKILEGRCSRDMV